MSHDQIVRVERSVSNISRMYLKTVLTFLLKCNNLLFMYNHNYTMYIHYTHFACKYLDILR